MVSIKHIAKDLGVSAATVSYALSGKGRVSRALAERIRARAEDLGYRPSVAARALKTGRSGILGLVMPDLTNPLFPRMAQTLATVADSRGLGILIADSRGRADEQSEALRRLVGRGVDGVLVIPRKGSVPEPQPVPMIVINTASDPGSAVSADHAGGGALVAGHLAALGHRRIAIIGGDPVSEVQRDRIAGMVAALPPDADAQTGWGDAGIAALAERVAAGATAVMTTSDLLALRAHSELRRAGLNVPGDVSLTGFDDLPLATAMHPSLTTVAQDVRTIAEHAIEMITARIAGEPGEDCPRTVPMRLICRESTSTPRTNKEVQP
ncbi:MAG: LacI family transcriptional regulator [Alphaproteobacteria bacterium]|nr:MAG: LacI family transcriptional regulator [Alphaproteobacteria bacterium]